MGGDSTLDFLAAAVRSSLVIFSEGADGCNTFFPNYLLCVTIAAVLEFIQLPAYQS